MLLCAVVEQPPRQTPPASPAPGQAYILAAGASGAWAGHDGEIAGFCEGGWRFFEAIDGMAVIERGSGETLLRRGGAWEAGIIRGQEVRLDGIKVIGAQQAAIPAPASGSTVDGEARAAIGQMLAALRNHGLIAP